MKIRPLVYSSLILLLLASLFTYSEEPGKARSQPELRQDSIPTIPIPLPLTCSGVPVPAVCAYGYVYYDGETVNNASVRIDSTKGTINTTTHMGSVSNEPYYQVDLSSLPLSVSSGEFITVTATYKSHNEKTIYQVTPGGQQIDVAIVINEIPFFGDDSDGNLIVAGVYDLSNFTIASINGTVNIGDTTIPVTTTTGFEAGDIILIHQSRGIGAGAWELAKISYVTTSIILRHPLKHSYIDNASTNQAQVVEVPQFRNCTVDAGGILTVRGWDGNTGGILVFMCNETATINGTISNKDGGYRGGNRLGDNPGYHTAQGESPLGMGIADRSANGSGGGGGDNQTIPTDPDFGAGGGGGHATPGTNGIGWGGDSQNGKGGDITTTQDVPDLSTMLFGGGGGQGGGPSNAMYGGISGKNGGGIIVVSVKNLIVNGSITARPDDGDITEFGGAGGGAGGSILLIADTASVGTDRVIATGGRGYKGNNGQSPANDGGLGGDGRIHIEYGTLTGSTVPFSDTITQTFNTGPIVTINTIYPQVAIQGQDTINFRATAVDNDEGGDSIQQYQWRSSLNGVLSDQPNINLSASNLSVGDHTIYFKALDNEGEWSEEISRTLMVIPQYVYLPSLLSKYFAYFPGPCEVEPNNDYLHANGPLHPGTFYCGYFDDSYDFFSIKLIPSASLGTITINLTENSEQGVQLQLFFETTEDPPVAYATDPPFHIEYQGPAGWYYIMVYTANPDNIGYTLRADFP